MRERERERGEEKRKGGVGEGAGEEEVVAFTGAVQMILHVHPDGGILQQSEAVESTSKRKYTMFSSGILPPIKDAIEPM